MLRRKRLAISFSFTEPDLWALWTLEVSGIRTCYIRPQKEQEDPETSTQKEEEEKEEEEKEKDEKKIRQVGRFDGQWRQWPAGRYCSIQQGELFELKGDLRTPLQRERPLPLRGGAIRVGRSVWVPSGLRGCLKGTYQGRTIVMTLEHFHEQSGVVYHVGDKDKVHEAKLKGKWTRHCSDGFHSFQLQSPQLLWRSVCTRVQLSEITLLEEEDSRPDCARGYLVLNGGEVPLYPLAETITSTTWREAFAGEAVGNRENVVTLAHPSDAIRRGESEVLLRYEEFDSCGSPLSLDRILGTETLKILEVRLTVHATTRKFRDKTFAEEYLCSQGYNSEARNAGHEDDPASLPLISPNRIYSMLYTSNAAADKHSERNEKPSVYGKPGEGCSVVAPLDPHDVVWTASCGGLEEPDKQYQDEFHSSVNASPESWPTEGPPASQGSSTAQPSAKQKGKAKAKRKAKKKQQDRPLLSQE